MKSIMMSIKPKWVAKILNGEKTIEIRKTMPKCDLPIDVYIYCTKSNKYHWYLQERYDHSTDETLGCSTPYYTYIKVGSIMTPRLDGKVIAKFTLNKVEEIKLNLAMRFFTESMYEPEIANKSCLSSAELFNYFHANSGYAWHISNLVIFDRPKELNEFYKVGYDKAYNLAERGWESDECLDYYNSVKELKKKYCLTKAPQSWCYVEGLL